MLHHKSAESSSFINRAAATQAARSGSGGGDGSGAAGRSGAAPLSRAEIRLQKDLMDLQTMQSRMLKICGVNGAAIRSSFICELSIEKGYYRHTTIEFLITIPAGYPFFAPTVVCTHKIFHPNIDPVTGAVGLALCCKNWKPVLAITTITFGLTLLMIDPLNDENVILNPVAAKLFIQSRLEFCRVVRSTLKGSSGGGEEWTQLLPADINDQALLEEYADEEEMERAIPVPPAAAPPTGAGGGAAPSVANTK